MITREVVDATWQEVGGWPEGHFPKEMERLYKRQPHLVGFVMLATEDLREPAQELAVYLLLVVHRMFEKGSAGKIKKISAEAIVRHHEAVVQFMEKMEKADEKRRAEAVLEKVADEPNVVGYIAEALHEQDPEDDECLVLTDEEKDALYLAIVKVIDALHEATAERN